MLAVADINPPVIKLPPVMLAVADINPPVLRFPPVTLAVADIDPPVSKLPPVMLPVDTRACNMLSHVKPNAPSSTPELLYCIWPVLPPGLALAVMPVN